MQSAGAHFSRDCQHKAQTSQKVKAGLSHDRRVCFRAQHGAAAGHGWRQGKSFRATEEDFRSRHPYQGNRLPVWPPVRRRLLDGGRTTRTWETGKGLGRQAGKNIFRPLEFRWVARLPKKGICEKRHKTDGETYSYPSCPFLQSPRPYRCPDAARRRSLWRASPTTHPGTDRPASSGREPAAPKDPKPGDFSDPVSPRPVRTSVFLRHKSTPGIILTPEAKRQQRKRPPVFFAKKVFPRKSSLPQARTPRRCSGFNPGKTSVSRFSGNPRWYRAISATTSRQSVATATSPSISR